MPTLQNPTSFRTRRHRVALCALLIAAVFASPRPQRVAAQTGPLTLGITVNDTAIVPGESLVAGITVSNPAGGPAADIYFGLLLPDGVTAVSTGPGVGVQFGRLDNLRSLVPVARGINLGAAFTYQDPAFFAYTFTGIEPAGPYRFFFAAFTAGALNDGVIGGGELLALATKDFTVGQGTVVQVDPSRTSTASLTAAGGSVQATNAGGVVMALTVPAGGLRTTTAVSLTPLTTFSGPDTGALVAGVRAEPSGLVFDTPATLTITLPPGFQRPAFGLTAIVTDNNGQNEELVPVTLTGNVATIQVRHFSTYRLTLSSTWPGFCNAFPTNGGPQPSEMTVACRDLQAIADTERRRLGSATGPLSSTFTTAMLNIMQTWMTSGILPRMTAAQLPGATDPQAKPFAAIDEFLAWQLLYVDVFNTPLAASGNAAAGRALGALIDQAMTAARQTYLAGMNQNNVRCVADKANALKYLENVRDLHQYIEIVTNGPVTPLDYCVDIAISPSPVPVLTPGTPSTMLLDVRTKFTDGVEMTGVDLVMAITATTASVSPAGGTLKTPIVAPITITPTTPSSRITITATAVDPPGTSQNAGFSVAMLPTRSVTIDAGQAATLTFTNAVLGGSHRLRDDAALFTKTVSDTAAGFPTSLTKTVDLPTTSFSLPPVGYTGAASTTATRTLATTPTAVVVDMTASTQASLSITGPLSAGVDLLSGVSDSWCVDLPQPFDLTPSAITPGTFQLSHAATGGFFNLKTSGPVRLISGRWCFVYSGSNLRSFDATLPGFVGPTSQSFSYNLQFRQAP